MRANMWWCQRGRVSFSNIHCPHGVCLSQGLACLMRVTASLNQLPQHLANCQGEVAPTSLVWICRWVGPELTLQGIAMLWEC